MSDNTYTLMLSGGIDSVTLAYHAKAEKMEIVAAMYFDYGQEAAGQELHAARRTALKAGIPLEAVNISGLKYIFYGLTDGPYHPFMAECGGSCGDLLAPWGLAATYSILRGVNQMLVGIVKDDLTRIPGLPKYIEHFEKAASALHSVDFKIVTPFIDVPKTDVIKRAKAVGSDLSEAWCCHGFGPYHCGECGGCERRKQSFAGANLQDNAKFV